MAFDLIEGPQNWAYWYPHGGFTTYPGEPGSGICTNTMSPNEFCA